MKFLKKFEEFLKQGIIKKQKPNKERANSLIIESKNKKEFLEEVIEKMSFEKTNKNFIIEYCYDVLIELIRANLFMKGFNSNNSHEAEISYMRNLDFNENDVLFMNSLRYFRNGIKYYGKVFDKEYSKKVLDFMKKIYPELISLLDFNNN